MDERASWEVGVGSVGEAALGSLPACRRDDDGH